MTDVNSYAKNLLNQRGRRAVATLLTWMEDNIWEHVGPDGEIYRLPVALQQEARLKILSVMGDYQDLAMDMVASDTGVINDFWVDALDKLHRAIRANGH